MLSHLLRLLEVIFSIVAKLPREVLEYVRDWLHFRKLANRFPGPPTKPLVGNLFDCEFFPKALTLINWIVKDVMYRYPVGQIWFGPVRLIFLNDINDIQIYLTNSKNQSKPKVFEYWLSHFGKGLLSINGDMWRLHHKLIKPSFHQNNLNMYVTVFNEKSDILMKNLLKYANGRVFDVKPILDAVSADIVYESLSAVPSNHQIEPDHAWFDNLIEGQRSLNHRIARPWLYHPIMFNLSPTGRKTTKLLQWAHRQVQTTIDQRINILREETNSLWNIGVQKNLSDIQRDEDFHDVGSRKGSISIIDSLLQERGKSVSNQEVLDELLTFFMTGYDTTAITLQFALYFLAKNPLVQEKAVIELRNVFEAAGSTEVTADVLHRMEYVEMIVKETLRLHTPVYIFTRNTGVDTPLVSCDLVVPAGADVLIAPRALHMDPKLYPDPHVFDPDRFSPENCAKRHPFAFIPFSAGMRGCIGKKFAMMALKTVISKLIWNYRILPDESYEPHYLWGLSMVTDNGMSIKLLKR